MIAWFVRNPVAANLLMIAIFGVGLYSMLNRLPLEVFPSIELDQVTVRVAYPGATPTEVEEAIAIRVEEAIQDLEGIDRIFSRSTEGSAVISVEVSKGFDARDLREEIKSRVDAIDSFPEEAERPRVSQSLRSREVISLVVWGDRDERVLRELADEVRDDLLALPGITQVELDGAASREITIRIPHERLLAYGLTLDQVAAQIRAASVDLSAGNIRSASADILLRSKGQALDADDFRAIPVRVSPDGRRLLLGDIAEISEGFGDDPVLTRFNGLPAVAIDVFRVGDQSAIQIADKVRDYIAERAPRLPHGVHLDYWRDRSKIVKARLNTLIRNAVQGGILVMLLLTLFLRPKVAFWVCVGIPVSFMGAFLVMPEIGITINIVSLFAFILVLGIVVDDAIVTGENIYTHFSRHGDAERAAIEGTREVAVPVTFGVLTTVAAFVPIFFIEGVRGAIFAQIPAVVIPVLLFSLIESKLVLPAHLRHMSPYNGGSRIARIQRAVADGLESFVVRWYRPALEQVLSYRYAALAFIIGLTMLVFTSVSTGWTRYTFFPRVQSEVARASLIMPAGTPLAVTEAQVARMTEAARTLQQKYLQPDGSSVITHVLSSVGDGGPERGRVLFEIVAPEERQIDITSSDLLREWRKLIGQVPGAESLTYRAEIGRGGDPIDVQLTGQNLDQLRALAAEVRARLARYPALFDINDSLSDGKQELQVRLRPEAELLGLSLAEVARQLRQAYFGVEVQTLLRGRDEVSVRLRLADEDRASLAALNDMRIRTGDGRAIPFGEIAELAPGRSPAAINRIDRRRTVNVTADADKTRADLEGIKREIGAFLQERLPAYPGVRFSLEGEEKEQRESFRGLIWGGAGTLFAIFALLAIPFRSWSQPLIVMSVIPFGLVGAVMGHWLMGMPLTIMSALGMLALSGVVVNDSLVLVDFINRRKREGVDLLDAVRQAGVARFRPVLLTSLTTFIGLVPLIFEKSTQAQFLIPMAVSLGFGILFATLITLFIIPVNYLVLEDMRRLLLGPRRLAALPPSGQE